jgi:hypothetical protein
MQRQRRMMLVIQRIRNLFFLLNHILINTITSEIGTYHLHYTSLMQILDKL